MKSIRQCCKIKCKCPEKESFHIDCENVDQDIDLIPLSDFLPRVVLFAKGVDNNLAIEFIRQACQNVAKTTSLLKRHFRFKTQANVRDYYIEPGEDEQVYKIEKIEHRKIDIPTSTIFQCNGFIFFDARVHISSYSCNTFDFAPPNKIILGRKPTCDGDACLDVYYTAEPTQNACEVDRLLYDKYQDVVVYFAAKELMCSTSYQFSNPTIAREYERKYNAALARAKMDVASGYIKGKQYLRRTSI